MTAHRAQGAFEAVWREFLTAIDAAMKDHSLTPAERASAVAAIRLRQALAAAAARKRVLEEERASVRARRKAQRDQSPSSLRAG